MKKYILWIDDSGKLTLKFTRELDWHQQIAEKYNISKDKVVGGGEWMFFPNSKEMVLFSRSTGFPAKLSVDQVTEAVSNYIHYDLLGMKELEESIWYFDHSPNPNIARMKGEIVYKPVFRIDEVIGDIICDIKDAMKLSDDSTLFLDMLQDKINSLRK